MVDTLSKGWTITLGSLKKKHGKILTENKGADVD